MNKLGFGTHCKIRHCFECLGTTEFYCKMCENDLCEQCKERHISDLETLNHDVVIYREKYKYIPRRETCVKHPNIIYKLYCQSCELPVCFRCSKHRKHQTVDIRAEYKTKRQQHRKFIHIRSETLYNNSFLLAGIYDNLKDCHTEFSNFQSEMSAKARILKNLINTMICDVLHYMTHRLPKQKRNMNRLLVSIEKFEHGFEKSANRPVKFLLFLTKNKVHEINKTPKLTQHAQISLTEEKIRLDDVNKLLIEIQVIETGKRQVRNECLLKLMSSPVLHRSVTVTDVHEVRHISPLTSDLVWISEDCNLILTNIGGDTLHRLRDIWPNSYGAHTVNKTGDLIYIDRDYNIKKLSKDSKTKTSLIEKPESWRPESVYFSPSNGDLLVGMWSTDSAKVTRYSDTGQQIKTIQLNNKGQKLYTIPRYITENRNGDVIVSDFLDFGRGAVVVTERGGQHRFSYTGPPSGVDIWPRGVCTDALSHILVGDLVTGTVQMIDKDGQFLCLLATEQGSDTPWGLSYDDKTHLLWVESYNNIVCVYRYIERQDYRTRNCN
ncbi:uncharacterized protein LOC133194454 [Saccostrea echinata]|uniref:uncharacterized protein LOC133194454 n=1 Tax=Saccostrea echinata TaxID=191078 RepID=UPI002A83ECDA|nr:uncharacterized protein LOC133194454 [Saccostrea echinata]